MKGREAGNTGRSHTAGKPVAGMLLRRGTGQWVPVSAEKTCRQRKTDGRMPEEMTDMLLTERLRSWLPDARVYDAGKYKLVP